MELPLMCTFLLEHYMHLGILITLILRESSSRTLKPLLVKKVYTSRVQAHRYALVWVFFCLWLFQPFLVELFHIC